MNTKMEMAVMEIINSIEEQYNSKEFKEQIIFDGVAKGMLELALKGKISSTDYADVLDILERRKTNVNQT